MERSDSTPSAPARPRTFALSSNIILGPGHTIKTGPLDGRASTRETSVLVVRDPSFPEPLDTPNGRVELLLLLGVADHYRQRVLALLRIVPE